MPWQLQIESLAYGGAGIGRRDGRAVFVDGAAPGDLVEVEPEEAPGRLLRGRLLAVVRPGPARAAPACPHFGDCGGCQWQHVSAEGQLEAKRVALQDALVRIAKLPAPALPPVEAVAAPAQFHYRRRARFAVAGDGRLAFAERGSRRLVRIESCALLEHDLERLALSLSEAFSRRAVPGLANVEACVAEGRGAAELQLRPGARVEAALPAAEWLLTACPGLVGLVVAGGGRRCVLGDPVLPDGELLLRPDVFAQANREGNRRLVAMALERLRPAAGDRAIELYCGSGNFTFALAERVHSVVAVEEDGEALRLARRVAAARANARVAFRVGAADVAVRAAAAAGERFDVALIDPPRAGARGVVGDLARITARAIAYVSCDPATLARDVGALFAKGFRPVSAAALDVFPQTFHLEALVVLERA